MKKSAEQSANSANQITNLINEIQVQTNTALQNTVQGNLETKEALLIAEDTKVVFQKILEQINQVNN